MDRGAAYYGTATDPVGGCRGCRHAMDRIQRWPVPTIEAVQPVVVGFMAVWTADGHTALQCERVRMPDRSIFERVLSIVEHNTNNRVQGETMYRVNIVSILSRSGYDPAAVDSAIDELVRDGKLKEPEPDELSLADGVELEPPGRNARWSYDDVQDEE